MRILIHRFPIHHANAIARRMTDEDVFGDSQFRIKAEFLIDRSDTLLLRFARPIERNLLSINANRARIRSVYA